MSKTLDDALSNRIYYLHKEDERKCPICLTQIEIEFNYTTICGHIFHKKCINTHFDNELTCPLCKTSQFNNTEVDEINENIHYMEKIRLFMQKYGIDINNPLVISRANSFMTTCIEYDLDDSVAIFLYAINNDRYDIMEKIAIMMDPNIDLAPGAPIRRGVLHYGINEISRETFVTGLYYTAIRNDIIMATFLLKTGFYIKPHELIDIQSIAIEYADLEFINFLILTIENNLLDNYDDEDIVALMMRPLEYIICLNKDEIFHAYYDVFAERCHTLVEDKDFYKCIINALMNNNLDIVNTIMRNIDAKSIIDSDHLSHVADIADIIEIGHLDAIKFIVEELGVKVSDRMILLSIVLNKLDILMYLMSITMYFEIRYLQQAITKCNLFAVTFFIALVNVNEYHSEILSSLLELFQNHSLTYTHKQKMDVFKTIIDSGYDYRTYPNDTKYDECCNIKHNGFNSNVILAFICSYSVTDVIDFLFERGACIEYDCYIYLRTASISEECSNAAFLSILDHNIYNNGVFAHNNEVLMNLCIDDRRELFGKVISRLRHYNDASHKLDLVLPEVLEHAFTIKSYSIVLYLLKIGVYSDILDDTVKIDQMPTYFRRKINAVLEKRLSQKKTVKTINTFRKITFTS